MTEIDLKAKLNDLYNIRVEFQKTIQNSNLSYVNNLAHLLKQTNIDVFIKSSDLIDKTHQNLEMIIKTSIKDLDTEIELVKSELNKITLSDNTN